MENRSEVRDFLNSRRARLSPEQAGIARGSNRRVPGLRRGEVAMLADVSPEYYGHLERGNLSGVSDAILHAIARALQLDEAEGAHLFDLARAANAASSRRPAPKQKKWTRRAGLQLVLDTITGGPAFVRNGRMDILATNPLGRAFYDEVFDAPGHGNIARYAFLDERARAFYPQWETAADITVAIMRTEAGRDPYDKAMHDLVGELSTRSDEFRTRWGAHNVRQHSTGMKTFHHHAVGDVTLVYEEMKLAAEPHLSLLIYSAETNTPTEERIRLLASLAESKSEPEPVSESAPESESVSDRHTMPVKE
ncbi:transcriptional regulator with XRE-family HTH domain [Microbacterium resistens]|uniref:Transcriptional regulator with XRE-family HTH domain n=1 Tax=Microbacterium resistens TaxID=156977 RepID=A0ABU1SGC3_9MICO|nr:helix-turn-helix transcriptional regulator [Microbacterium resistens]MDR6867922.1 transcriptional regulator with XRE-family HTH domain [Microbacterium resistens]